MEKTSSIFRKIIIWIGLVIVTFLTVTSFFKNVVFIGMKQDKSFLK